MVKTRSSSRRPPAAPKTKGKGKGKAKAQEDDQPASGSQLPQDSPALQPGTRGRAAEAVAPPADVANVTSISQDDAAHAPIPSEPVNPVAPGPSVRDPARDRATREMSEKTANTAVHTMEWLHKENVAYMEQLDSLQKRVNDAHKTLETMRERIAMERGNRERMENTLKHWAEVGEEWTEKDVHDGMKRLKKTLDGGLREYDTDEEEEDELRDGPPPGPADEAPTPPPETQSKPGDERAQERSDVLHEIEAALAMAKDLEESADKIIAVDAPVPGPSSQPLAAPAANRKRSRSNAEEPEQATRKKFRAIAEEADKSYEDGAPEAAVIAEDKLLAPLSPLREEEEEDNEEDKVDSASVALILSQKLSGTSSRGTVSTGGQPSGSSPPELVPAAQAATSSSVPDPSDVSIRPPGDEIPAKKHSQSATNATQSAKPTQPEASTSKAAGPSKPAADEDKDNGKGKEKAEEAKPKKPVRPWTIEPFPDLPDFKRCRYLTIDDRRAQRQKAERQWREEEDAMWKRRAYAMCHVQQEPQVQRRAMARAARGEPELLAAFMDDDD